jgi:hypothetical protein
MWVGDLSILITLSLLLRLLSTSFSLINKFNAWGGMFSFYAKLFARSFNWIVN